MSKTSWLAWAVAGVIAWTTSAGAGPPYLSDDAEPTDDGHFEIYLFGNGTTTHDDAGGQTGIDFNYGAAPDLQLTATLPADYEYPTGGHLASGLGNVEFAAKYRFLHQESFGWDVAIFPRVFLPSGSSLGEHHASFLLPIWLEKDWDQWSTFGGGGCTVDRGQDSRDFCLAGWALTRRILPALQIGAELFHQTADTKDGRASTIFGVGATYDLNQYAHLMGYVGAGLQNAAATGSATWYASVLFTF
ncbi:MAG: transporter [Gemmataceae bacterium]